jgi:hypothetical protein
LKKWVIFSTLLAIFFATLYPIMLYAEETKTQTTSMSLWDSLIPQESKKTKVGQVEVKYNQVPLEHYRLDLFLEERSFWELDDQLSDSGHYFLHSFTNMFWQGNVEIARILTWVMEESLTLDVVKEVGESIGEGIRTLAGYNGGFQDKGFYGIFLPLMVTLLGGWIGWKTMVTDDDHGAARGIISSLVVIFGSYIFFYFASDIAAGANQFSSEITKGTMALTSNITQPNEPTLSANEATVEAGNKLWEIMVIKPYQLLQFGTTDVDQKRMDKVLKTAPENRSAVIQNEVKTLKNLNMTTKNSGTRLGFTIMVVILNLVIACVVLMISVGIPFFSLYFLFVLMLSPIALTWAVMPPWRNSLYQWAGHALGALLMKLALGVLMSLYFAFSGALYSFTEEKGYLMTMLIQYILLALMIWKRKDIYQMVTIPATSFFGNPTGTQMLDQVLRKGLRQADQLLKPIKLPNIKKPKKQPTPTSPEPQPEPIPQYEAEMITPEPYETEFELIYPDNELEAGKKQEKLTSGPDESVEGDPEPAPQLTTPEVVLLSTENQPEQEEEESEPVLTSPEATLLPVEEEERELEPTYELLPPEAHTKTELEEVEVPPFLKPLKEKQEDENEPLPLLAEVKTRE